MPNEQNLKPRKNLSKEEAKILGSKGGKKSVEVRREKKILRELLEEALEKKTKTGNRYVDITNALIQEAERGNVKAYETIRDTLGQKPKEEMNLNHSGNIDSPSTNALLESISRQLGGGSDGAK